MTSDANKIVIRHKDDKIKIRLEKKDHDTLLVGLKGETIPVDLGKIVTGQDLSRSKEYEEEFAFDEESNEVRAPIPGVIAKILVQKGEEVQKGQVLVCLLAMKMENEICTTIAGRILNIHVSEGQAVQSDDLLITLEAGED